MRQIKILLFCGYYLPGYKMGGPARTLENMVDQLGNELQFKIVTRDRDLGDTGPYKGVNIESWNKVGKASVYYLSPRSFSVIGLRNIFITTEHDLVYLNSFFNPIFTIKPLILRRMGFIPKNPVILAPRGNFSLGALRLKGVKKQAYLVLAKAMGLHDGIVWQASSAYEESDIRRLFGDNVRVVVAPDLPSRFNILYNKAQTPKKARGKLKILFLSRINPIKNLDGALNMLKGIREEISFNIYGPMEDPKYWSKCKNIMNHLPRNIDVKYCGTVAHSHVGSVMRKHHIFLLPTLGENFGHVILEALTAGLPVIVSDKTPWRELEKIGVGWDIPIERKDLFQTFLQYCIDMDNDLYNKMSKKAKAYGLRCSNDEKVKEQNRMLFKSVLSYEQD